MIESLSPSYAPNMPNRLLRVRHGVLYDPVFGFRAVREWDGTREFLGPWTTENVAQSVADEAARLSRGVVAGAGGLIVEDGK